MSIHASRKTFFKRLTYGPSFWTFWVQAVALKQYPLTIKNFLKSNRNGLAFDFQLHQKETVLANDLKELDLR